MNDDSEIRGPSRRRFLQQLGAATLGAAAFGAEAAAPLQRSGVKRWDLSTDVLVVGSSAGGISAAIEARRSGAQVIVLEKFHVPGGSSSLSGGVCYLGGGTPLRRPLTP